MSSIEASFKTVTGAFSKANVLLFILKENLITYNVFVRIAGRTSFFPSLVTQLKMQDYHCSLS